MNLFFFAAMILGALAVLSFVLNVWQFVAAMRFPLHQRLAANPFHPPVTVLKPLKGADDETESCLRSWLTQEYPGPLRFLFGVSSPEDPACAVVRKLLSQFPLADAHLILCNEQLGANAKVSTLKQLEAHAHHPVLVVSDADVWASPDFLADAVAPLADAGVGLVNAFYQLATPVNAAMRWEGVAINADFWSQVLQSRALKPIDFALGAAMVLRRSDLEAIGGFTVLLDYLADDYQLGQRIAGLGKRIELCPVVVECRESPKSWDWVLRHQLRWARTIRVCQPGPYFLSILSNATLWPLVWLFSWPADWVFLAACLMLVWRLVSAQALIVRLTRGRLRAMDAPLVLMKDLFGAAIWAAAFIGDEVDWRGERFQVERGGKLRKIS